MIIPPKPTIRIMDRYGQWRLEGFDRTNHRNQVTDSIKLRIPDPILSVGLPDMISIHVRYRKGTRYRTKTLLEIDLLANGHNVLHPDGRLAEVAGYIYPTYYDELPVLSGEL